MFFYKLILPLFQPIGLAVLLLLAAVVVRKRRGWHGTLFGAALAVLLVGGNHYVAHGLARSLERRVDSPEVIPEADVIIIVSGGLRPQEPPRRSIEVDEAGDRTLYAARLYREGKAPLVLCSGGIVPGSTREHPNAEDDVAMLRWLGVPAEAIASVGKSRNTYEDALYDYEILKDRGAKRALLVTSALHMPRSLGVFRRVCRDLEFVPAPTDYRDTDSLTPHRLVRFQRCIPSATNLQLTSEALHEYVGLLYYRLRGWL